LFLVKAMAKLVLKLAGLNEHLSRATFVANTFKDR
jgi:hypothetical protein